MKARGLARITLGTALVLAATAALAPAASADDSQIRISEIYADGSAAKDDFFELQMMADGQQIAAGRTIRLYSPTGAATISFVFPASNLPPISQRSVLLGWDTNLQADFSVDANLIPVPAGGAVCLLESNVFPGVPIDCITWGNYTGAFPVVGTPAPALNVSQSLSRTRALGCATALDLADDTNNSAADFTLGALSPRNSAALPIDSPCPPAPLAKKKCKKKKGKRSAEAAKKKRCKKKKRK